MLNPKGTLVKILEIIEYKENKDSFADTFLKNTYLQSISDLISTLPQDKAVKVKGQLSQVSPPQDLEEILKEHFTEEKINEALKTASSNSIQKYIKTIEPTLTTAQRQNLQNHLQTLTSNQDAV